MLTKVLMNKDHSPHDWEEIAPPPHHCSALLQDTTHLLAVGGDYSFKSATTTSVYDPHNKWFTVGQLLEPCAKCTVVSLSRRSFVVCDELSNPNDLSSVGVVSVQQGACMY